MPLNDVERLLSDTADQFEALLAAGGDGLKTDVAALLKAGQKPFVQRILNGLPYAMTVISIAPVD